jgi:NitT/TauT family transport system substrate-binding protein
MSKKILAYTALLAMLTLSGCNKEQAPQQDYGNAPPNQPLSSNEAVDVNVGLIMGPPSMGLGYFMNEAEAGRTFNRYNFEVAGVDYSAVAASLNQGDYDIATLPSNVAAILYNNQDMNEDVEVISIGNLGLLYLVTTDPTFTSLNNLHGRTVYSIGEGGPPEYTFNYVLEKAGLTDNVNFSFRPTPFEVLNLLQEKENSIALLPQPFVEVAKLLVPELRVAVDLTETWDELNKDSDVEPVTTVTVVRKAFREQHEQAVAEYLNMSKQSTDYILEHLDEAAAWTEKYETFLNPEIAKEAIPQSSIHTITGKEMKHVLSGFLQIMYDFNPEAIGGKMPGEDFYYLLLGE